MRNSRTFTPIQADHKKYNFKSILIIINVKGQI